MQTTEPRFCHMEDQQRRNVNKKKDIAETSWIRKVPCLP